jgi:hypothetical protein
MSSANFSNATMSFALMIGGTLPVMRDFTVPDFHDSAAAYRNAAVRRRNSRQRPSLRSRVVSWVAFRPRGARRAVRVGLHVDSTSKSGDSRSRERPPASQPPSAAAPVFDQLAEARALAAQNWTVATIHLGTRRP